MYIKLILITSWIGKKVISDVLVAKTNHHEKLLMLTWKTLDNKNAWNISRFYFWMLIFLVSEQRKVSDGALFSSFPNFCLDITSNPLISQLGTAFDHGLFEKFHVLSHPYSLVIFFLVYCQRWPNFVNWINWYSMKLLADVQSIPHSAQCRS